MGVAYYIALDNEEAGFDTFVSGKSVARAIEELDAISERHGLPRLEDFMGQPMSEFADMLGDDTELPDDAEGAELWFEPEAGIAFLDALSEKIRAEPQALTSPDEVLGDLAEYRQVLMQAKGIGAKWHWALDI